MSIILFGKGPSVLRCNRNIVDEHQDIGICNYPVLNDSFYPLIKDRVILYHFANCGTFDKRYDNSINKKLNIQTIYNTNQGTNHYNTFLKDSILFSNENIYPKYILEFKNKYNFKPSTGIVMLNYILDTNKYNKITLVGYDNYEKNTQMYYSTNSELNDKIKYLIDKEVITKDGKIGNDPTFEHSIELTEKYIYKVIEQNPHIEFTFITNMKFNKEYNNLKLL